ncbi:unnamed protein product [Vitrella brassicaformis CCMP3155]|uniref:PIG-P domain-containing protein n=2 Tax=Vitrella brassicaformis TaxID=1169539 RepID=A0A0G4ERD7_VITBC|nr:unnamed protein product [Vitrella brassicaformis CCMP3155]|mmetsp:Transcript_40943/g.116662  ORF Transcript_40943/g.116662 Transcript_40943/m.116662 type:complete len:369 (-) Transcript_40943:151-1257(-)|eukprot:CEM00833.1 unnamed protein product [Vitrella brassicaformis CCMP3155]
MADITTEVYGFVFWILSYIAYGVYLCWAFIPESVLEQLGITVYPSKYWAIALPTYLCVCVVAVMVLYYAYCLTLYVPLDDNDTPPTGQFPEELACEQPCPQASAAVCPSPSPCPSSSLPPSSLHSHDIARDLMAHQQPFTYRSWTVRTESLDSPKVIGGNRRTLSTWEDSIPAAAAAAAVQQPPCMSPGPPFPPPPSSYSSPSTLPQPQLGRGRGTVPPHPGMTPVVGRHPPQDVGIRGVTVDRSTSGTRTTVSTIGALPSTTSSTSMVGPANATANNNAVQPVERGVSEGQACGPHRTQDRQRGPEVVRSVTEEHGRGRGGVGVGDSGMVVPSMASSCSAPPCEEMSSKGGEEDNGVRRRRDDDGTG